MRISEKDSTRGFRGWPATKAVVYIVRRTWSIGYRRGCLASDSPLFTYVILALNRKGNEARFGASLEIQPIDSKTS